MTRKEVESLTTQASSHNTHPSATNYGKVDKDWLCRVLERNRLEVIPTATDADIASQTPAGSTITVTSSAKLGVHRTVALAIELRKRGFHVVPHLAARGIQNRRQLAQMIDQLLQHDISEVFIIGGDQPQPVGEFPSATALLEVLDQLPQRPQVIGVAAYPEGHPHISSDVLWEALLQKQRYASYAVLQICFDADAILKWISQATERGFTLPVYLCLPGTMRLDRLVKIALRLGLGASLRYLEKQKALLPRLLTGGEQYDPWHLLETLARSTAPERERIVGVHWSTFNAVSQTVAWIQSQRMRLGCVSG